MKKLLSFLGGVVTGIINVLLGAGGGILAVFLLKKSGMPQKEAQANAIAVIFPLTIISLIIYLIGGYVNFYDNIYLLPTGVLGALIGTFILKKISPRSAKIIFGLFMVWAGVRLLIKL